MTTKFSHQQHQNILQPKRSLNSAQVGRVQKGDGGPPRLSSGHNATGSTLTLNGITIGLPSSVHHIGSNSHIISTPTTNSKKGPNTMAKRNARERNRVKQVNQGFQTLRQHIPEGYRLKKMSKVDTLRCALNYIRSMERVLDISSMSSLDHPTGGGGSDESTTESPYHGYTSDAMNQHLDKICSETSISLDQSFSSFSDHEDEDEEVEDVENPQQLNCHPPHHQHHHHHQSHSPYHHLTEQEQQQQQQCFKPIVSTSDNNGSFQNTGGGGGGGGGSIILPLRLTSSHSSLPSVAGAVAAAAASKFEVNMPPSDENFHPSPNFVRVVEIVQLQT